MSQPLYDCVQSHIIHTLALEATGKEADTMLFYLKHVCLHDEVISLRLLLSTVYVINTNVEGVGIRKIIDEVSHANHCFSVSAMK